MRKAQVQKAFESFCGGWLLPVDLLITGGQKSPQVSFSVSGVPFIYSASKNCVMKPQARDTLQFDDAKSVLGFIKKMEEMKAQDPHSRGRYD